MAAYISGIPVYEALVEGEDTGMVRISLVDDPAVLVGWQAFRACLQDGAANGKPVPPSAQMYSVTDEERRIVRGVVMRADFPIYRRDAHGEYFVIYHADTIREMAEKYLAESRQNNVDTMHDGDEVQGVQMVQWFIKDKAAGINPAGFDADIADGSLFAEFHITDDAIWEAVKAGTYKGFSLEGVFAMAPEQRQQTIDEIVDELAGQFQITDMSKIERLKEILRAELARQEKDVRPEKFGAVTTDRGPLEWDGEDDLKAGDPVYAVAEDGTRTAAEDGDYKTEDGKTIVVAGGVVAEIRDPEAEVATDEGAGNEQEDNAAEIEARRAEKMARKMKFEESYDEKVRKIADAVNATLGETEYGYIVSAGDDFAVAAIWSDEDFRDHYYRYAVTWNEDGSANVSDRVEVRQAFVPMDYDDAAAFAAPAQQEENEAEELRSQLNAAQTRVTELEAELEAARQQPMAKPAHEEVRASATPIKTGNRQLDRLTELFSAK